MHIYLWTFSIIFLTGPLSANQQKNIKQKIEHLIGDFENKFKVPTLSVENFLKERKVNQNKIILVDVRDEDEQKVSIIPGAISRTIFEKNMTRYKNKKIVAYCTIGYRSAKYVEKLEKQGYNAWNLRGSILSWLEHKQPVVDSKGNPVKKVHVFGKKWEVVPKGYETVKKSSWIYKLLGY